MVKDGRLYVEIGETCPYSKKCRWECIAKYKIEMDFFSCGIYKENITDETWK